MFSSLGLTSTQKIAKIKDLGVVLLGDCLFYPPKHAHEGFSKPTDLCLLSLCFI